MSTESVTTLLEEAAPLIDYFEGKLPAKVMRQDIESHDYEALRAHIREARDTQFNIEYNPSEIAHA